LGYAQPSGTSSSAPLVTGVAALLRATEPALTPAAVGDRLRSTAHDAGLPGRDDVYGSGIVDAAAALGAEPTQPPRPPATGDAYEPNDAPAAAAPITTGTISATIAPEGEVDRYRLSVPEYTRTTVRSDAPVDGGETTGVDPILTVLGPSGAVVAARDATGSGGSETTVFDTATAGTYTVVVENFLPTLGTGPYRLAVSTADLPRPATTTTTSTTTTAPPAPAPAPPPRSGYWMVGRDGTVYGFGDAQNFGSIAGLPRAMEAVDLEPTPTLRGYWVVTDTGHVYAFGDAPHLGALNGALTSGERVTSISATPSGRGYWLFTTRGRVVGYGDAPFLGDMAGVRLNGAVLDSIPTPTGRGYYMVGSDGGIFTFGDAVFEGSMGGVPLNAPVQSLVPDADGGGYWLVASDGGIFSFEAPFRGSMGDVRLNGPITGMVRFGNGYLMVGTDGGIFTFTDKEFYGSLGANPPPAPITAVAVAEG
jgi:hypothetical protein